MLLSFTLSRGGYVPKDNLATSLHASYEACFRVLNENPSSSIDFMVGGAEHNVTYPFASFRELHKLLLDLGIQTKKKFPETFLKSSFGLSMTERELQVRANQLHDWFEELLFKFPHLTAPGQVSILTFLKMNSGLEDKTLLGQYSNKKLIETVADDNRTLVGFVNKKQSSIKIIVEMLHRPGTIYRTDSEWGQKPSLPTLSLNSSDDNVNSSGSNNNNNSNNNSDNNSSSTVAATPAETAGGGGSSPRLGGGKPEVKVGGGWKLLRNTRSAISTSSSKSSSSVPYHSSKSIAGSEVSEADLSEIILQENSGFTMSHTIKEHLMITVERGLNIAKLKDENSSSRDVKTHISYLTTLAIMGSDRSLRPMLKQATFDKYRDLAAALHQLGVSDNAGSKFIIKSHFPVTYKKSSLGLSLTQVELSNRIETLSNWIASLLTIFPALPDEAKHLITSFFDIQEDNLTHPQFRAILEILHPDWDSDDSEVKNACRNRVLLKPESRPENNPKSSDGKEKKGNESWMDIGKNNKNNKNNKNRNNNNDDEWKEIGDNGGGNAPPAGCGVSCAIM